MDADLGADCVGDMRRAAQPELPRQFEGSALSAQAHQGGMAQIVRRRRRVVIAAACQQQEVRRLGDDQLERHATVGR
jgi:hypothetical protein